MNKSVFLLLLCSFLAITACDPDPSLEPATVDYADILIATSDKVIIPTYEDMSQKTASLANTLYQLQANPSASNLEAARQAWRDARVPWEQSEGFLYGPVETLGIDPSIDSWPVNRADLDAVLSSGESLTKTYVDGLEGTLKGFHTIEYLLFGIDANKQFSDFTTRQFEYLSACSQSLQGATQSLLDNWKGGTVHFGQTFKTAGQNGNAVYPSQKAALQEIVNGLITIADEVANGKINEPFAQQDLSLEESRFSANSKADFADNIRSIQNTYTGTYNGLSAASISDIVKAKDATLDATVRQQMIEAITAITAIEGTFTSAIFNAKASVQTAQNKVRNLQETLQSKVLPVITGL